METVERVETPRGELVLRRDAEHYELISNGVFLMDTRSGSSERLLVRAALDGASPGTRLLIAGLGVGYSLAEAVGCASVEEIVVVEIEPSVVAWHGTHLAPFSGGALDDPRVRVVTADLGNWLATTEDLFDAICLDVDNGPDWTVFGENAALYDDAGTAVLGAHLRPGGVLAVWSAAASDDYAKRLETTIGPVRTLLTEVERGEPDVVYLARLS
ncbi:spermine/spermidine synthase [Asanoa ferruginea]|uniref:Spermine/spermidine synthase n=1 Tax=Asanoa ferruginea TaxID=53367 RepID=A0A3D9ZQZ0_9ACTN|nr:spermidine synthase [Asanoa ferruginea]REF99289.1 spermine/spermidine synthase [Asanoa ferruginea]GIF45888.1 spermidine synthase [Asanoa ferruginea]